MDACSHSDLLPFSEALNRLYRQLQPVTQIEWVSVSEALDRVVAAPVLAAINVPAGDNSAMDGYALRSSDCAAGMMEFEVIGEARAGHPWGIGADCTPLAAGQAVRIMTGALIPAGADTVIMQENTQRHGQRLALLQPALAGDNIRRAGEDIAQGSQVLAQGQRLTALHIGLLASLGIAQVQVLRKLRVAVLTTGDELLAPGAPAAPGKIYDSNRPLLLALLQRLALEVKDFGIVADDPAALRQVFTQAAHWADVVISTGGVSVGDADYTKDVLAELGQIDFWKIAMKPGKPFAFGRLGQGWFFGLPGNPVSTAVTYHQLVVPALRYLAGEGEQHSLQLQVQAGQSFKKQPGRLDFQRGIVHSTAAGNQVVSAGLQSSGVLSGMAKANCYLYLEQARGSVAPQEWVPVIPFDRFIV